MDPDIDGGGEANAYVAARGQPAGRSFSPRTGGARQRQSGRSRLEVSGQEAGVAVVEIGRWSKLTLMGALNASIGRVQRI
jgi:hypothetical protein